MIVSKAQGQIIPHVTIWFDKPKSPTATAYVAMSLQLPMSHYIAVKDYIAVKALLYQKA